MLRLNRVLLQGLCLTVSSMATVDVYAWDLRKTLVEVLASHPDIRMQQANLAAARQDVSIAKQQFLPTPSVSLERAQASASDSQYRGDAQVAVFRLQQPLWTGGRLTAALGKAETGAQLKQATLEETRQQLAISTVQTWGELCAADARLAAVARNLMLHRELQDKVQRRVHEGASAPAELTMTEGRVAQVKAQFRGVQAQRDAARGRLSQLVGRHTDLDSCPDWPVMSRPLDLGLDQFSAAAEVGHPTLIRLRMQVAHVQHEVDERKADLWPEVFVRAEQQRGNFAIANSPAVNRVFVGFSSRLGAGLSTLQHIESGLHRKQSAEQELEGGLRKVHEQVQTLWIQLQDVQERLPSLEDLSKANWATQEAWDRQFLAGRKSWLDVMNAARELMQSEMDLADARVNLRSLQWRLALSVYGVDDVLSTVP